MKRSQLEAIIREALDEVLNEKENPAEKAAVDAELNSINKQIQALNYKKSNLTSGKTSVVSENDLDELANVAVRYQLAPDVTAADFPGKKGRIITAMQAAGEPMSKMDVAAEMGYNKQNPINADFMALVASGAIVPAGQQAAPRFSRPQPEPAAVPAMDDEEGDDELPAGYEDPEGGIAGDMSDEEIEASFARMKAGGEDEEEIEDIEVDAALSPSKGMSDEEFEAWMAYQELERRLANVKSNILKARKSRPTPGDIQDRPSNEVENLRDLKKRLEDKMMAIVSKFPTVAKDYKAPEIDVPEEEETLDEWTMNKMKYYAGIVK